MIIFVIVTIIVYAWRCCGAKSSSIPEAEIKLYMPKTHCCFPPYDSPHSWQYLGRILGKLPSCQLVHGWGLVVLLSWHLRYSLRGPKRNCRPNSSVHLVD